MENIIYLKITFVATMSSIFDNHGTMFVESLNNFSKMFKDVSFLENSIAICINKCNSIKRLRHIENKIKEILKGCENLTVESK